MKKILLIGLILAICILAMPQGVLAVGQGTGVPVVVDAAYGATSATDFTATLHSGSGVTWPWPLIVGTNTQNPAIDFSVTSLAKWDVTGVDSYATPSGRLVGHMHGQVGDLQNAYLMSVGGTSGSWYDFTGSPVAVKSGVASTSAQPWSEALRQVVTGTDFASTTGYHSQITFTCSAPF